MSNQTIYANDLFEGKKILVTGGRSGIGYAIAKTFLQLGGHVAIASRKLDLCQQAADELSAFGKVDAYECDIRNVEQVEELAEDIDKNMAGLDIVINNAGGQFPCAAENITPNGFDKVVANNLHGTWHVTQTMTKRFFFPHDGGSIVNIIANIERGFPGMAHMAAARGGVVTLTKTLAVEWAHKGVRINSVAPGVIESSGLGQYPPHLMKDVAAKNPTKRLGTVQEVADLTVFLAGPGASYITGETVYVDGGQRLWGDMWMIPDRTPEEN